MESIQTELNLYGTVFPKQEIELVKLEKKVFDLIPLGKENAKAGAYIADVLDISTRYLTDAVRSLRLKHYDIGSTTYEGYYRFLNPQEYLEFMSKSSKDLTRRKQVQHAMGFTKMAQKIAIETSQMASIENGFNFHGLIFPNQENELTELEKLVFKLIPVGKENIISCNDIANVLNIATRHVKNLVRNLRLKHYDVGSTTNGGYYIFQNIAEYLDFMNKYSKEQTRREEVIEAMRVTPMAQKIMIKTSQSA